MGHWVHGMVIRSYHVLMITFFPPLQTYELLTGRILFQPQPIEGLTADGCLLLLQHSLTDEVLDESIIERAQRKGQYFDSEGESQ